MAKAVTYFAVEGVPLIGSGDDLAAIILEVLKSQDLALQSGDVIVIAQKIVSKSENRYVNLQDVSPSAQALALAAKVGKDPRYIEVVLSESKEIVRHWPNTLIAAHKLGYVMANAGIDQSNIVQIEGGERVLLLPRDPDGSATELKTRIDRELGINVAVIINDSFGRPWRKGVVGVALGAAGLPSLLNLISAPDMFGRPMQVTEIAVADEIAAGASLLMGQASEGLPVIVVRGLKFDAPATPASALLRPREQDMFR